MEYSLKLVGIYTQQEPLVNAICEQLHLLSKHAMTFSFFNQKQKAARDLTKDAASFLWFQLLFSVQKELPQADDAKNEMLA